MKKITIVLFILMLLLVFSLKNINDVEAETFTSIDWELDNTYDPWSLIGTINFNNTVKELLIDIPESEYHIRDSGSDVWDYRFYDENDILVSIFQGEDVFGVDIGGTYTYQINFDILDIDPDAVYLVMSFPQTFSGTTLSGDIIDAYMVYINANSSVTAVYEDIGFSAFRYNMRADLSSASSEVTAYMSQYVLIPDDVEIIGIRRTNNWLNRLDGEDSEILLYNSALELIDTILWVEALSRDNEGEFTVNISILEDVADYEALAYFRIKVLSTQDNPAVLLFLNTHTWHLFDGDDVNIVNFYADNELIYSHYTFIGGVARYFPILPSGGVDEEFSYWMMADGTEYTFTPLKDIDFINGTVSLYAYFIDTPTNIVGDVTNPVADEGGLFTGAITNLGFNDPISRTIVFGFVAIITAGLMMWKSVSMTATIVVVGCELFFFMYLGLLPAFVSIIIILLLGFVGWGLKGGGGSE